MESYEHAGVGEDPRWNDRARRWVAFDSDRGQRADPIDELAMDRLELSGGEAVLDIGCGTGWSAVSLADRVGAGGQVVGLDISHVMAAQARFNIVRHHTPADGKIAVVCADAACLPFGEQFDAIYSRLGLMFFDAPLDAFTRLRQALRSDGRIAFVSWADVTTNDWFMITSLAVLSVTRRPVASLPHVRRASFSLADPTVVENLLKDAGFRDVRVNRHISSNELTKDEMEQGLAFGVAVTGLREFLDGLTPEVRARAIGEVRRSLWARARNGRVRLRSGMLIAAGRK